MCGRGKIMIELDIIDGKLIKAFATDGKACFSLEIPEGVTEVADGAFAGAKKELFSVTKIVLPASLRRIGAKAFKDVTRLRSLKLPSNLEYIGDEAFAKLEHIKTLTIPNKVTHIGKRAFCGCIKLNKIKIGKGVAEIGEGAFADCSWVRSVEGKFVEGNTIVYNGTLIAYFGEGESFSIPANVERIGDKAFSSSARDDNWYRNYPPLGPTEVILHDNVRSIGDLAFYGTRIKKLHIPQSVEKVGANPIAGRGSVDLEGKFVHEGRAIICGDHLCAHLPVAQSYSIPDSVSELDDYAFCVCRAEEGIVLPPSIKRVGDKCFYNCGSMKSIILNEGLERIGNEAFGCCDALMAITFPASLKSIGEEIFTFPEKLTCITFLGEEPPLFEGDLIVRLDLFKGCVKVPAASVEEYKKALPYMAEPLPQYPKGRILPL